MPPGVSYPDFDTMIEGFRSRVIKRHGIFKLKWLFREDVHLRWTSGENGCFQIDVNAPVDDLAILRKHYDFLKSTADQIVFELIGTRDGEAFCSIHSDTFSIDQDDTPERTIVFMDVEGGIDVFPDNCSRWVWRSKGLFQSRRLSNVDFLYRRPA